MKAQNWYIRLFTSGSLLGSWSTSATAAGSPSQVHVVHLDVLGLDVEVILLGGDPISNQGQGFW